MKIAPIITSQHGEADQCFHACRLFRNSDTPLQQEQQRRGRHQGLERPQRREPGSVGRALVDERTSSRSPRGPATRKRAIAGKEAREIRDALDRGARARRPFLPQEVGAHVGADAQRVGGAQHEHRRVQHVDGLVGPGGRRVEGIARDDFPGHRREQRRDQPGKHDPARVGEAVDRAGDAQHQLPGLRACLARKALISSTRSCGSSGHRLRADHAVHPLHVLLHARHHARPLRRGVALRIGQHVALVAGHAERLARRLVQLRIARRVERLLRMALQVGDDAPWCPRRSAPSPRPSSRPSACPCCPCPPCAAPCARRCRATSRRGASPGWAGCGTARSRRSPASRRAIAARGSCAASKVGGRMRSSIGPCGLDAQRFFASAISSASTGKARRASSEQEPAHA